MGQSLLALNLQLGPTYELVLAGELINPESAAVLADVRRRFLPNKILAGAASDPPPPLAALLAGKAASASEPTLYVCEGFTCDAPAVGAAAIEAKLATLAK
jgi:uncharacterized protein YyaL (SSP411 family)